MLQRFLDPLVLAQVARLDLIAKTVVDGFVAGLHRSPDFGFSQEFAEYRSYTPGDDLRHVDWSVYARSERLYLKRYRGETNSQLSVLVDASNSMSFASGKLSKIDYARFAAASLFYLANAQRDAAGLVVFDDEVRNYVPPSTRQGQFHRLLHGIEQAEPRLRTNYSKPFQHLMEFLRRRGVVVVFSDFYEEPETVIRSIEPLRFRGNDVVLFHVLDPRELDPKIKDPVILVDLETQDSLEVTPDYAQREYRSKITAHCEALRQKAKGAGMDYYLMATDKPLDGALHEYLSIRLGRL
ncbi:MAG: DUF58 domain-containing protein [Acidobacteria bacterium]|nr:DUF58 domain-containing protein [Acidobacteriota bacterium]